MAIIFLLMPKIILQLISYFHYLLIYLEIQKIQKILVNRNNLQIVINSIN